MFDPRKENINYQFLLQHTYREALEKNDAARRHWEKIKEEYSTLESLLGELPKDLSKDVMVPVAPRALMKGKIVHTNEILVCLGQGYFVKRSAAQAIEICKRRGNMCRETLVALHREQQLLEGRGQLPVQMEAFGGSQGEIIEAYDEQEEVRWQEEHKEKEKAYRQKLAELRQKEKTAVKDEESLWKRLDELELQEELEEELDRLHAEDSDDIESSEESENEEEEQQEEVSAEVEQLQKKNGIIQQKTAETVGVSSPASSSRRVSFATDQATSDGERNVEVELRIEFKHSTESASVPSPSAGGGPIQSPGELYTHFKQLFGSEPRSILKKTSSYSSDLGDLELPNNVEQRMVSEDEEDDNKFEAAFQPPLPPPVAEVVVERTEGVNAPQPPSERPVSRFKAMRQLKRR